MPGLLGGYCETDAERAAMEQYDYDQWRAKEDANEGLFNRSIRSAV